MSRCNASYPSCSLSFLILKVFCFYNINRTSLGGKMKAYCFPFSWLPACKGE